MKKEIDKLRDDKNYYGEEGKKYLSNSDIKSLLYTPKQFRVPVKETIEMVLGRYIHQRLLEPDKAVNFPVYEGKIRKGAEYEKFLEVFHLVNLLNTIKLYSSQYVSRIYVQVPFQSLLLQ